MERYYMYFGFESPEQLREYLNSLRKPRPTQVNSGNEMLVLYLVGAAFYIVMYYFENAWATPTPQARVRGERLREAEGEASDSNTTDHEATPSLLSENASADSNIHEEVIPSPGPSKQDVPPTGPPDHSDADGDPPEQDIAEWIESEDRDALSNSQVLNMYEESLHRFYMLLIGKRGDWVKYRTLVLLLRDDPKLRQYNFFQDQTPSKAGPMLKMLQGPAKHISGALQATTETKASLRSIIKFDLDVTGLMDQWLPRHANLTKGVLEVNAAALEMMRDIARDSDPLALSKFDGLMKLIEQIHQLILEQDSSIDAVLGPLANAITKRQGILDELVRTATADTLIALMKVPSGWEIVQARIGPVARGSEPGRRSQGLPTEGLRSGTGVPADIVDNVFELSRMFGGPSKEMNQPLPDAVAQASSLLSRVEDPQHAEVIGKLYKAQEDLQKLSITIEGLQRDHQTSRADHEATVKDQEEQAAHVFASKVKACLEKDMLQLSGSMRERWQRYVQSITGLESKQPGTITPAIATTHSNNSADCESTTTTIIG